MKFPRRSLLFILIAAITFPAQAQMLVNYTTTDFSNYKEYTGIMLNGESILKNEIPDGPLILAPDTKGKLSVSTMDRTGKRSAKDKLVGFKIAIKNHHTSTFWMYSEDTFYEIELQEVLKKCEAADKIIFMTVDRQYKLPRNEVRVMTNGGC